MAGIAAVLLQARLGSRRLPRKVLATMDGVSLLAHCVTRLQSAAVGPVVVATTTLGEDDAIVAEAQRLGVATFRGDSDDVLGRFAGAAAQCGAEFVVRATADNPAVDPQSAVRLIARVREGLTDHAVEDGLPYGCTVEAFTAAALRDAAAHAQDPADREHVTTYLRRPGSGFTCLTLNAPAAVRRPDLRFTIDTPADLAYMRRVLAGTTLTPVIPLATLIAVADGLAGAAEVA